MYQLALVKQKISKKTKRTSSIIIVKYLIEPGIQNLHHVKNKMSKIFLFEESSLFAVPYVNKEETNFSVVTVA